MRDIPGTRIALSYAQDRLNDARPARERVGHSAHFPRRFSRRALLPWQNVHSNTYSNAYSNAYSCRYQLNFKGDTTTEDSPLKATMTFIGAFCDSTIPHLEWLDPLNYQCRNS